ncbi:MAG: sel1 repeat family protein [Cyanobacteria bacterium RYN_339]|nr:sel1 repeat family protein [Cyanobacteria bacterium RYN_339]
MDIDRLRHAAANGNTDAMWALANAYEFGMAAPKDPDEALRWLRLGAAAGSTQCQRDLGERVDPSSGNCIGAGHASEAEHWYQVAIGAGNMEAAYPLGRMLAKLGREAEARTWLHVAAERGEAVAMRRLGDLCEAAGELVDARGWYQQAALLGDDLAKKALRKGKFRA